MLLITCHRGLEEVSERELKEFGLKVEEKLFGKIIAKGKEKDAVELNYYARTINRVIFLLWFGIFEDLEDIEEKTCRIPWEDYIEREKTFGVEAKRVGKHSFTSMELAMLVGRAVMKRIEKEKGFRPRVFLEDPDIIVYAEVNRERLFLGIDTTGDSLHMRGYRVYQHPAPISPSLASSLLYIAGKPKRVIDPFCGSGTIPIENVLMHWNIPKIWRNFAFEKIEKFREIFEKIKERKPKIEESFGYGFEKFKKHVEGAKRNAESAGVSEATEFWVGDATNLESYRGDFETIVTNPPYGLRIASKRMIEKLYDRFAKVVKEIGSELVLITGEPYFIKAAEKAKLELVEKKNIIYGSLPALILHYFP